MKHRIALAALCLILLSGCAGQQEAAVTLTPTPTGNATPVAFTPAPTPTPEPEDEDTVLEESFQRAKEIVREMPQADGDPLIVYPYSGLRLITPQELRNAAPRDLEWAWREIVARYGNKEFKSYDFTDREWYEYDPDFTKFDLTEIEAMNILYMRNSAMEHYSNMKIVKNNRAQADLDGDGKNESFSFSADRFSDSGVLQIGTTKFTIELPMIDNRVFLCNIDHFDDRLELAIPFTRDGTDDRLAFFAYDGEMGLIRLGELQGGRDTVRLYGTGTIKAYALDAELCAWRYPQKYALVGNTLVPQADEFYSIRIEAKLLKPLALTDQEGGSFTLPDGNSVVIAAVTARREYIVYDVGSQRYGYFMMQDGLIAGDPPDVVFEGLPTEAW